MWKCPSCDTELSELQYEVNTTSYEVGTAQLIDREIPTGTTELRPTPRDRIEMYDSSDQGDTNWDGDPTFSCPECGDNIEPRELIWTEETTEIKPINIGFTFAGLTHKISCFCSLCINEREKIQRALDPEESLHNIIKPEILLKYENSWTKSQTDTMMICKHCQYVFTYELNKDHMFPEDESYECPKCEKTTTAKEYFELLKKGYFNKKRKIIHLKHPDDKKNSNKPRVTLAKPRKPIHN